jgi:hypothetical protein
MAAGSSAAQLDALQALLATARQLSNDLAADPTIGRMLRAFVTLPPEDRDVVAGLVERGTAWRRITENTADVTGVALRANPHASLFVRVVDARDGEEHMQQDHAEILLGSLRIMKQMPLLLRADVADLWREPAVEAFSMLEPAEREACRRFASLMLELIADLDGELRKRPPD